MTIDTYSTVGWEDYPKTTTPITAANLNKMDEQIKTITEAAIEINKEVPVKLTGILTAGETQLIFTNDAITEGCTYLLWTDIFGVSPTEIAVTDGALGTKWDAQDTDLNILLKIYKED